MKLHRKILVASALFSSVLSYAQTPVVRNLLLSITEPKLNETISADLLKVDVHLWAAARAETFRAQVNGVDVTAFFDQTAKCQSSGVCDREAYIPTKYLLHGANAISVEVNGPEDTVADDRVKFQYQAPTIQGEPVSKLTPSVAVWSVKLKQGGSPADYKDYEIVVGPGANFPQVTYKASDLSCPNGIDSVEVLVLQRKSLTPEAANGRGCFGTAQSLEAYLKSVPKNDLVILNNFLGRMPALNTTAIGGTDYRNSVTGTNYYSAIGVAGAPAGSAYESYQPNASHTPRIGITSLPPLNGSLMLDTSNNYNFVPKDYPELKVKPGTGGNCATINFRESLLTDCLGSDGRGGFWIVAIDRRLGTITDSYELKTNSNDATRRSQAIKDLVTLVNNYYKSNDLLVITTVGTPFRVNTDVTADLWGSINALGGNGYIFPKLTDSDSTYTLITSPDPAYTAAGNAKESTTARAAETGKLDVVLGRDRKNQFGAYQDYSGSQDLGFAGNAWPSTLFQQPTDWPAWTPAQEKAYIDLTSSDNNYPTLHQALGCTTKCQPFREYYSGNMSTCMPPSFLSFNFDVLVYQPNAQYTESDFKAVTKQLATETGYENNVYSVCALVRQLTDSQKASLQKQLVSVGNNIDASLSQKAIDAKVQIDSLSKYGKITAAGSSLPFVGAAFSAIATTLNGAAVLVPTEAGVPGEFTTTLRELNDRDNTLFGDRLTLLITNLFTAVANDWGKLSVIGNAYGSQEKPWYFCPNCTDAVLPINALPFISLEAKRGYYRALLPTAYSMDVLVERKEPDPRVIERWVRDYGLGTCMHPYGGAPQESFWSYPGVNNPSTWDVWTLTQTAMVSGPGFKELRFPTTNLLNDLLSAPVINTASVSLSGGAGLKYEDLRSSGTLINVRSGYLPGAALPGCNAGN